MSSVRGFKFGHATKGITVRFSENTKSNTPQPNIAQNQNFGNNQQQQQRQQRDNRPQNNMMNRDRQGNMGGNDWNSKMMGNRNQGGAFNAMPPMMPGANMQNSIPSAGNHFDSANNQSHHNNMVP